MRLAAWVTRVLCRDCSVGHRGKFGHEFVEFEFRPDGRLRYANNSKYKNDVMIRKEGVLCGLFSAATVPVCPRTVAHARSPSRHQQDCAEGAEADYRRL